MEAYVGRGKGERGAILIQVAISIMALTAFTAFVVDYGVLWVARGQAQNAADAGALAGAIARTFDDIADPPATTIPFNSAKLTALCASKSAGCPTAAPFANPVWPSQTGASSAVEVSWDCPPGFVGRCVRVNVYRDGSSTSVALPMFVGPLLGIASQGVKATASALVGAANATDCMKPFAIPDLYTENSVPTNSTFEAGTDVYTAPTTTTAGTGYVPQAPPAGQLGTELVLKGDGTMSPGEYRLLDLVGGGSGGTPQARRTIRACVADIYAIGDDLTPHLQSGVANGIRDAMNDLIALDPSAQWDDTAKKIINSCVSTHSCYRYDSTGTNLIPDPSATVSPRVMALPIFDPQKEAAAQAVKQDDVEIVNILGFFLTYMEANPSKAIHGKLVAKPGVSTNRAGSHQIGTGSAYFNVIQLVR
jgi:Flp pilus assembly protein TadG